MSPPAHCLHLGSLCGGESRGALEEGQRAGGLGKARILLFPGKPMHFGAGLHPATQFHTRSPRDGGPCHYPQTSGATQPTSYEGHQRPQSLCLTAKRITRSLSLRVPSGSGQTQKGAQDQSQHIFPLAAHPGSACPSLGSLPVAGWPFLQHPNSAPGTQTSDLPSQPHGVSPPPEMSKWPPNSPTTRTPAPTPVPPGVAHSPGLPSPTHTARIPASLLSRGWAPFPTGESPEDPASPCHPKAPPGRWGTLTWREEAGEEAGVVRGRCGGTGPRQLHLSPQRE